MVDAEHLLTHSGRCHCGAVRFEVDAPASVSVDICNCSICDMVGFEHLIVPKDRFRLLQGQQDLHEYTFGTGVAKHLFCKRCGVKSFYVPRSHPNGYSVNFRCVDQTQFGTVSRVSFDGQNWEQNIDELQQRS